MISCPQYESEEAFVDALIGSLDSRYEIIFDEPATIKTCESDSCVCRVYARYGIDLHSMFNLGSKITTTECTFIHKILHILKRKIINFT